MKSLKEVGSSSNSKNVFRLQRVRNLAMNRWEEISHNPYGEFFSRFRYRPGREIVCSIHFVCISNSITMKSSFLGLHAHFEDLSFGFNLFSEHCLY